MGGRGGASSIQAQSPNSITKEKIANKAEIEKKLPSVGGKVQESYIDYVKRQTNIDLSKARDTQFDNRNGFNIDTRKLTPSQMNALKKLNQQYPGGYEAAFMANGANRLYIRVRRKKK